MRSAKLLAAFGILVGPLACDPPAGGVDAGASASVTSASATPVSQAVITLDDTHDMMKGGSGYAIAPATELVIEIGAGRFADAGPLGGKIDAVHVVQTLGGGYYRGTFSGGARLTLNSAVLDAVKGSAFAGFEAGQKYVVAIGTEETTPEGVLRFTPAWSATVEVKPK